MIKNEFPIWKHLKKPGWFLGVYGDWSNWQLDSVISNAFSLIITLKQVMYHRCRALRFLPSKKISFMYIVIQMIWSGVLEKCVWGSHVGSSCKVCFQIRLPFTWSLSRERQARYSCPQLHIWLTRHAWLIESHRRKGDTVQPCKWVRCSPDCRTQLWSFVGWNDVKKKWPSQTKYSTMASSAGCKKSWPSTTQSASALHGSSCLYEQSYPLMAGTGWAPQKSWGLPDGVSLCSNSQSQFLVKTELCWNVTEGAPWLKTFRQPYLSQTLRVLLLLPCCFQRGYTGTLLVTQMLLRQLVHNLYTYTVLPHDSTFCFKDNSVGTSGPYDSCKYFWESLEVLKTEGRPHGSLEGGEEER